MAFWQENYGFIKDVYDTRVTKMVEWMDHLEMAIGKVLATRVYTSAEFKRERDNFLTLCKNLERNDTKKWLSDVKDVLFRDRAGCENKDEEKRLAGVLERHKALIPKIQETQTNSEIFWKCYEYGDDLVQIFDFIDDQRAKCVRDILLLDPEATEEMIDKHAAIIRLMENKRGNIEQFIARGEKILENPKAPKFLEGHVKQLKDAWAGANEKAKTRKDALDSNLESWHTFDEKKVECAKGLDMAEKQLKCIKKNFDMEKGAEQLQEHLKIGATMRIEIEDLFNVTARANKIIKEHLPADKHKEMDDQVIALKVRLDILDKMDAQLALIYTFNKELVEFDKTLRELETYVAPTGKIGEKLEIIRADDGLLPPDPEDRITKSMEALEDIMKKSLICSALEEKKTEIFPGEGQKVSKEAKEFLQRLKTVREIINKYDEDIQFEANKYSGDVKFFAEYQTCIRAFHPWLLTAQAKVDSGLAAPTSLVEACQILGQCKTFQDECEEFLKILDASSSSATKMTYHTQADITIQDFRDQWENIYQVSRDWVARMIILVECWNRLDGKVGELSSWVSSADSTSVPEHREGISIEKLEDQLHTLKQNFEEKQQLVDNIKVNCRAKTPEKIMNSRKPSQINLRRETIIDTSALNRRGTLLQVPTDGPPKSPKENVAFAGIL